MNLWTNPDDSSRQSPQECAGARDPSGYSAAPAGPGPEDPREFPGTQAQVPEKNGKKPCRRKKREKRGFVLLFCSVLALMLAFALGMGTVFVLDRYTDLDFAQILPPYDFSVPNGEKPDLPELGPSVPDNPPDTNPQNSVPEGNTIASMQTQDFPVTDAPRVELVGVEGKESLAVGDIADRLLPSVVSVVAYLSENDLDGYSLGTGTIYSADGYILTNYHVIENGVRAEVILSDGTVYEARHISSDATADIAILKIDAVGLEPVEFGRSALLRIGDPVVAIGNPASLELYGTTTAGHITGPERYLTMDSAGNIMKLIQTDASVNPGNSGGPLINSYGQVIGIVTAKLTADTYEGIGFAIASDRLEKIVSDLLQYGYVTGYPMLGITGSSVMEGETDGGNPAGVLVAEVSANSGAAGQVLPGDVIYSCGGNTVRSISQINAIKARMEVGDTMVLSIYRQGAHLDVEIVLKDKYDID